MSTYILYYSFEYTYIIQHIKQHTYMQVILLLSQTIHTCEDQSESIQNQAIAIHYTVSPQSASARHSLPTDLSHPKTTQKITPN